MKTKLVLMMVVFSAVAVAQANLFTNGGFDTDAAGWTPDPVGHSGHAAGVGNPPGSYLLNSFGEADNDPYVEQTVSGLTPGATYRVSWELALHVDFGGSSANGLSFGVFLDGNPIHLGEQLTTDFVADSVTFMATNSSHTFRFAGELDPRTPGVAGVTDVSYYIDNITLIAEGECIPPPLGMINWWPGDGDANDIVGDAHGALSNGATFAAGKVSEAFRFDGVDDYVALPDNPAWNFGTGDFTIDFWALSTNSNRRMHALSFEPQYNTRNLNFDFNDPDPPASSQPAVGLWVYWNSTGVNQITAGSPGDFTDGQWHHFALTRSGDTFTLYVDGAAVGSANYSDAIDLSNSAVNYIGAGDTGTGAPTHFWDGLIDEVEIFNRALSAEEITAIFNAGSAGKCKPGTPPVLACSLAPAVDTNQVDQTHTVTVTVTTNGSPVQASVSFSVTGANTAGSTGHVTDSNGQAQFTYTGHVAGTDTIRAIATLGELSTTCTATKVWIHPPAEVHDLAIIRMKAPKNINLKGAEPSLTKRVVVQIQNRSPHDETITNLAELVRVTLTNLQDGEGCAPDAVLIAGPPNQPGRVLKPKQKMNVFFNVTFTGACVPNPLKGAGNEDFRYRAVVNHTALDGNPDTHPTDDECPRAALPGGVDNEAGLNIKDKACPEAKTDVIQK